MKDNKLINNIINQLDTDKTELEKVELSTLSQLSMYKSQIKEYINGIEKIGKKIENETDTLYDTFAAAGTAIRNVKATKKEIEKQLKALGINNYPAINDIDALIKEYNKLFNKYR